MIRTTVDHVDEQFRSLIEAAFRGEEVFITLESEHGERTVKLTAVDFDAAQEKPMFGSARGKLTVPDDFNDPIEDFKDYQPG